MPMPPLSPPLVSGESARTGLIVHIWTHALYQHLRYGFLGTVFFPLQTIFIWDHTEYAMLDSCGCSVHILKIQYTQYMFENCYKTCITRTQIRLSYAFSELIFFEEYQISYHMIDLRFCRAPDAIHKYSKSQNMRYMFKHCCKYVIYDLEYDFWKLSICDRTQELC